MRSLVVAAVLALLSLGSAASAEVIAAQPAGFEVVEHVHIASSPAKVWIAIGQVASWWSSSHTYSQDAANLSLHTDLGDCFCERWNGGAVGHMIVVASLPTRMLRLEGALGPLGGLGVAGHLTFDLKPEGQGTDLKLTYDVGGWSKDGLDKMAAPVDQVLGEQMDRLSRYVTTGKP
ncbi:MAG: SRPBCC family protein [Caulobacteraceae bacterium]|nr:SRPBCC family protein [Caulobacteraceae bacterium]